MRNFIDSINQSIDQSARFPFHPHLSSRAVLLLPSKSRLILISIAVCWSFRRLESASGSGMNCSTLSATNVAGRFSHWTSSCVFSGTIGCCKAYGTNDCWSPLLFPPPLTPSSPSGEWWWCPEVKVGSLFLSRMFRLRCASSADLIIFIAPFDFKKRERKIQIAEFTSRNVYLQLGNIFCMKLFNHTGATSRTTFLLSI